MSWDLITSFFGDISKRSTFVGKVWLTVLLIFRIVLTAVAGNTIYHDEHEKFTCNTTQPGCENVCYDAFAPLSQCRYWALQVIVITWPSIMYLGYSMHKMGDTGAIPIKGLVSERKQITLDGLMMVYGSHLLFRAILEVAFLIGQGILYGSKVHDKFICTRDPCPDTVDCFIARPTEKTIFLWIMYTVSSLCLLLTLLELFYLYKGRRRDHRLLQAAKEQEENPQL